MEYKVLQKVNNNGTKENQIIAHQNEDEDQQIVMSGNRVIINDPKDAAVLIKDGIIEDPDNPQPKPEDITALKERIAELEGNGAVEEAPEPENEPDEPEVIIETVPAEEVENLDRYNELKAMNRKQQRKLAKKLKLSGYSKLNEEELIKAILEAEK